MLLIVQSRMTVHEMAQCGHRVTTSCQTCRAYREIDLVELATRVGPQYSLVNRRCRCRLTKGCQGWNRFFVLLGVVRPLWDDATAMRWMVGA